jgi:hypothetical protein
MDPRLHPLKSSNLSGYLHCSNQSLLVCFANGTYYMYSNVPMSAIDAMVSAPSIGSHFSSHIRNRYDFAKVEERDLDVLLIGNPPRSTAIPAIARKWNPEEFARMSRAYPTLHLTF